MGILQGLKRTAASVPNAEPGYVMFFIDENGRPKYKDELGVVGDYLGFKGYAPIYSTVVSGDLVFLRVTDWDGGEGAKPATGQYVSSSGLVLDINLATNFRGPQGIQGIQGIQGFKGWGPVLSVISDADRRVFQVADWVGGEGAKPATGAYLGATGFVFDLPSAIDVRGPQGLIGPSSNAFSTFSTPSGTSPVADQSNDTLTFLNGTGISISGNATADEITITNTDTGSSAVTTHEAAVDPHPQYLTAAEGNAAYQPVDAELTAVAGLTTNGLITKTSAGAATTRTITQGTGITVVNGDGVSGNPTITNSDTGSSAVSSHVAAGDPHTQYAQSSFSTISTPSGTSPVADSRSDTLNLAATGGTTITGDASTDTITIGSVALTSSAPSSLGASPSVGVATTSARADHVHQFPTPGDIGAQPVDSDLTAIAGLATSGLIARTGTGTATTRSVAAGTGISVSNGDGVAGNPTVTNTDTGSAAVTTHEAAGDPHPQYLTTAEGNAAYQPLDADLTALAGIGTNGILVHTGAGTAASRSIAAGYGVTVTNGDGVAGGPTVAAQTRFVSNFLTSVQPVSVLTPTLLTGHQIVLAPGERCSINAVLAATAAAATTGIGYSINVAQGAGANANAIGSAYTNVNLTSAAAATPLQDGDVFNVAAGANTTFEVLGTATVAGNNGAQLSAVVWNQSTNANTTIEIRMRSEVNGSAVTAQIGTGFTATIGLT